MTNLTTGKSTQVKDMLKEVSFDPILILVTISPRYQNTGYLEEQGNWILRLWSKVVKRIPNVVGCRNTWNGLFFACPAMTIDEVHNAFCEILKSMQIDQLKSRFASIRGSQNWDQNMEILDHFQIETLGKGACDKTLLRLLDGVPVFRL